MATVFLSLLVVCSKTKISVIRCYYTNYRAMRSYYTANYPGYGGSRAYSSGGSYGGRNYATAVCGLGLVGRTARLAITTPIISLFYRRFYCLLGVKCARGPIRCVVPSSPPPVYSERVLTLCSACVV